MICIELPLWLAICIVVSYILLLLWLCIDDFLVKVIHKKYDLELKDKENKDE